MLEKTDTNTETTNARILAKKQLDAIAQRAEQQWGDKWIRRLTDKYEEVTGSKHRSRSSLVESWFSGKSLPRLDNFNSLLEAVGCNLSIIATTTEKLI
ncbi:MAG: hypothetical protein IM549_02400 [Pseudanabaena sp. M53BS1SP1A06MG]|nr:hypothetical protein [Pseudanabaena sp. M53BS1SP1A06MG]